MRLFSVMILVAACGVDGGADTTDPTRFIGRWRISAMTGSTMCADGRNTPTDPSSFIGQVVSVTSSGAKVNLDYGQGCPMLHAPRGSTATLDPAPVVCKDYRIESSTLTLSGADETLDWTVEDSFTSTEAGNCWVTADFTAAKL